MERIDEDNNNIKFVNSKGVVKEFNIQNKMFNRFQEGKNDYVAYGGTQWYRSSSLFCRNSLVESFSIIMIHYSRMWYFVLFRIDSFETKSNSLLYNKSNCSKYFYSYFKYYLNHFAILPTQITHPYVPQDPRLDLYQKIANYCSNNVKSTSSGIKKINNINPILVYYFIWSCIDCIIHKRKDLKYTFDCKIRLESHILNKDSNTFVIDSNKTCKILQEYVIDQLAQTNVFRNYFVGNQTPKIQKDQIEIINKCKEYLLAWFNKLLEYSIEDLVSTPDDIDDYKKLFREDNKFDSGFWNIIGNRLFYGVFYDVTMYSLN